MSRDITFIFYHTNFGQGIPVQGKLEDKQSLTKSCVSLINDLYEVQLRKQEFKAFHCLTDSGWRRISKSKPLSLNEVAAVIHVEVI